MGRVTIGGGGMEVYPGAGNALSAGTNLIIDYNFNRNQQVNSVSVKQGISKLVITKVYCK